MAFVLNNAGAITVHEYMTQVMTNAKFGYYQNSRDKIGKKGGMYL